jgi:hypothetical protein
MKPTFQLEGDAWISFSSLSFMPKVIPTDNR